ncbi:MAG TPA: DNA mismatch repair protein MutS, partial [Myxococcota bacterium]|nr:DNA mismatch repair protein MutS [Myxococcota bacterium]
ALLASHTPRLRALSRLVAETDCLASLGQVADEGRYVRAALCDAPVLELTEARHAVLERLMPGGERFVPNDVVLDAASRQLMIVTGPNMAGKSTVMRQAALCVVMAHMGGFVPAKRARIGLCDRLFTRVGAADNLGRGHSTFMVEMMETATILRHATPRSLVLLDEIGRGTSTFDGVSIAWAVAEHLHDVLGCRAMFATHYHELTDLALERPRIVNASAAVKELNGEVVFLRRLVDGAANRSYGIQVAKLAGLPGAVLERATEILGNLERGELDETGMPSLARSARGPGGSSARQLTLFGQQRPAAAAPCAAPAPPVPAAAAPSAVEQELLALDIVNMTPVQALCALERLRGLCVTSPGAK